MGSSLESTPSNAKRAAVIYDSRYGNTEKIARSLEIGLRLAGFETVCTNAKETSSESLKEYDLIAVGAPTEKITASESIKEFLDRLKTDAPDLNGKAGFAFDTKLPYPLTGSAAKYIEKQLNKLGLSIIVSRESALVFYPKGGKDKDVRLKEGEEKRFEDLGRQVGTALLARGTVIPA
jgi:flavodoxin